MNAFGFELHGAVAEPGQNTVTSPLSAAVLLAMVAVGAGGQTAEEMVEVLRLEEPRDTRYAALLADLTGASAVTLSIANSLWAADGYPFEDDYIDFVQDTFGATLDEVDLGAQQSADRIDDWVEERTEGLIEEIAGRPRAAGPAGGAGPAQRGVLPGDLDDHVRRGRAHGTRRSRWPMAARSMCRRCTARTRGRDRIG